jgi:hypothetical protein
VAQRSNRNREDVQAVIQVLAELALVDGLHEIPVRCRNNADIDFDGIRSAEALELAFLEHAEEFDLNVERNFADLIQENGSMVGQLEAPNAAADRARKRPLLVTEQLGLDQTCGQRGAAR